MSPALNTPLRFRRLEIEKPWGGRALSRCPGLQLASTGPVGETWEIVDRPGEEVRVAAGPHEGRTLGELMAAHASDLLGKAPATAHGRFPLLVKYLDTGAELSVQVHPDDEAAARVAGAEPKTEAWYFLATAPGGGRVYAGLCAGTTPEALARDAGGRAVLEHLVSWDVVPGQCLVVPGGTVHTIGGGVTLLEVQQNSDTTYRFWDWDRADPDGKRRETHVERALAVTRYDLPRRAPVAPTFEPAGEGVRRAPMARTRAFAMNLLEVSRRARLSTSNQFQIYAVERGAGSLATRDGSSVELARGDVWLVPAATGFHYLEPSGDEPLALVQFLHKA